MRFYRRGRLNKDTYLLKDMHFTVEWRYGLQSLENRVSQQGFQRFSLGPYGQN